MCIDGQWTKPKPPCKLVRCPDPGDPGPYMELNTPCRDYNCQTSYACTVGYWYTGTSPITCQRDSTWTHGMGTCDAALCPELPAPVNGTIVQPDRYYGKTATTTCDNGFIISDKEAATRQCQGNNTWSGKEVKCNAVHCPPVSDPRNGKIQQPHKTYKATATTVCDEGYVPTDPDATTRHCQGDNNWSGKEVNCTRKRCPPLTNVENGNLSALSGNYKDKVTLQCNSGYMLDGVHTVSCEASGEWDAQIGKCIRHKNDFNKSSDFNKNLILIILPIIMGIITIVVVLVVVVVVVSWVKSRRSLMRSENLLEMQQLLNIEKMHFTFVLAEDLGAAYSGEAEYNSFISIIKESIRKAAMEVSIDVDVIYLCKKTRRGFLSITPAKCVGEKELVNAISNSEIILGKGDNAVNFHVFPESIHVMDTVQSALSAQILRGKHVKDRDMDDEIDFNTQYVKLKLLSHETIDTIQREEIERPDYYQHSLGQQSGIEIQDEDIIKGSDFQKYKLIRGRAGIGKSTLMQRLLWKWANGEWATQFKAIFLLNLRYLMTITQIMDLLFMLNMCSVYRTGRTDSSVSNHWLEENEMGIAFVLDGVDEVDFTGFDVRSENSPTMRTPLQWCFALMRRDILKKSTLIVSSRPFAELGKIARTLKERTLSETLQLVQLVGLTRERVHDFVNRNVHEGSRDFVWQTLVRNPILMSISSITFYCAALCKILGEWKEKPVELSTYTQITSFIMKSFIKRSMQKTDSPLEEEKVLHFLSSLAFGGLRRDIGRGPLRLVFDSDDIDSVRTEKDITRLMLKCGLLMQTEIPDPADKDSCTVLNQFVHLLIQEFLAMAGLLARNTQECQSVLTKLGETQQFSMATVFLYGLAFNSENEMIKQIFVPKCSEREWQKKQEMLMAFAQNCSELEAVQIAHESQSADVAHAVGQNHFKDGCCFKNTKLTVIDILAVTFVMKHNPSIHKLSLERAELDIVSLRELAKFIKSTDTAEEINLVDDTLDDTCVTELMSAIRGDATLKTIKLSSDSMTDDGLSSVADTLLTNRTLKTVHLLSKTVTDKGIQHISKALTQNRTLENLRIVFRGATDEGLQHVVEMLKTNKTLKELWVILLNVTDKGVSALGQALCKNSSLESLRIDCRNMTDKGVLQIADSVTGNRSLTKLWLLGFYMKEDGVKSILRTKLTAPQRSIWMWEPEVHKDLLDQIRSDSRIMFLE